MANIGQQILDTAKTAVTTKTGLTTVATIATAAGTYAAGEINLASLLQLVFTGLIGLFLRVNAKKA